MTVSGRAFGGALQVDATASTQSKVEGRGLGVDQGDTLATEDRWAWWSQAETPIHYSGNALAARILAELSELRRARQLHKQRRVQRPLHQLRRVHRSAAEPARDPDVHMAEHQPKRR